MFIIPYFEYKIITFGNQFLIESWKIFRFGGRILALYIVLKEIQRLKLSFKTAIVISIIAVFLTTFFEKLLFFLSHKYLHADSYLFHFTYSGWNGLGRVYFGALIGLAISIIIGALITRQSKEILKYFDIFFLALIAGTFFYRIGNFLWHSHVGKITDVPWGMLINGQIRHEISLYELISLALIFSFVWPLRKKMIQPGLLSFIILAWMSLSRLITDFFRSDDLPTSNFHFQNGLTLNQVAYGALFILCFNVILFLLKKQRENSPTPNPQ